MGNTGLVLSLRNNQSLTVSEEYMLSFIHQAGTEHLLWAGELGDGDAEWKDTDLSPLSPEHGGRSHGYSAGCSIL